MTDDVGRSSDSPVSRETSTPPVPAAARGAFPVERQALVERFVELLATAGVVRGLIGPREAPRLWTRHVLNCAVLAQEIPEGVSVCDVGSGAGLPGLVLALARPDLQIVLVEPLLRRTTFLSEVVDDLGLTNVRVERGRADALHGKERFDVVTSRAVAALPTLLEWSMPLVAPTGVLLALKGESAADEVAQAGSALEAMGCGTPEVLVLVAEGTETATYAVRVPWANPASVSWPAAAGVKAVKKRRTPPPGKRRRGRDQ